MILQEMDIYTILVMIFVLASCMCAPIGRALQARRLRQMQQARGEQVDVEQVPPQFRDRNLRYWEETLLTTKDHAQKLNAIAQLGKIGTKETLDMLSEYAENDRNPEILAAIETALEQLETKQIERRIKGEIEGHPGT